MGTLHRFELTIDTNGAQQHTEPCRECGHPAAVDTRKAIRREALNFGTLGELLDGDVEPMKWYDHEADMRAVSEKFPGVLFTLDSTSERGEHRRTYFRDGRAQRAETRLVHEDFDPKKLA